MSNVSQWCVAVCCSVLQCVAVGLLQRVAVCVRIWVVNSVWQCIAAVCCSLTHEALFPQKLKWASGISIFTLYTPLSLLHFTTTIHHATHCNALQYTATQCNALQRSATLCNDVKYHCPKNYRFQQNMVSLEIHTSCRCGGQKKPLRGALAIYCNTLQRTATLCKVPSI